MGRKRRELRRIKRAGKVSSKGGEANPNRIKQRLAGIRIVGLTDKFDVIGEEIARKAPVFLTPRTAKSKLKKLGATRFAKTNIWEPVHDKV